MVVRESSEEVSSVLVPGERHAADGLCAGVSTFSEDLFVGLHGDLGDVLEEFLSGEVEYLDSLLGSDNEPVQLLGEEDTVDGGVAISLGQELSFNEIPDHDGSVAGAGGEVR